MKLFLIMTLLISTVVAAQDQGAKNIYYDYVKPPARPTAGAKPAPRRGRPGAMVKLELKRDEKVSYAQLSATFFNYDRVKLHIRINRDGYLTILNQRTTGDLQLIYPKTQEDAARKVTKTTDFTIPTTPGNWLKFDDVPGTERLIVILSDVPTREMLVRLSGQTAAAAAPPPPNPQLEVIALLNSKSLGNELEQTSKDFTETSDEADDDGQPATFVVSASHNADLRKPVIYKLSLRHAARK